MNEPVAARIEPMTGSYTPEDTGEIVMVTGFDAACAAMAAAAAEGRPVILVGAAGGGGAGWWLALERQARTAIPRAEATFVLDCADEAGRALEAIRAGVGAIALSAPPETRRRVAEIAAASGCHLVEWTGAGQAEIARHHESGNTGPVRGVAKPGRVG